MARNYLPV